MGERVLKIRILGAGREVGRAGILVEYGGTRILLDYGAAIDTEPAFPLHVAPKTLDAVFLSHAHLDHSGALPMLYVSESRPLYATPLTLELSEILIRDFLKISKYYVPYEVVELESMLSSAKLVRPGDVVEVGEIEVEVVDAGHIPGSCMFKLRAGGLTVLYTGDYSTTSTCLLKGVDPSVAKDVDVLITEATYAKFDHPPREKVEREFVDCVLEVLDGGGVVLVPAFSVGRAQEMMCVLHRAGIPHPVYVDGMARRVAEILLKYGEYLRDPRCYERAYKSARIVADWRSRKRSLKRPCVLVSPAGMLKGGASVFYMERILDDPRHGVFFVSYQIEETPGRMVLEDGVFPSKVGAKRVKARVEWFDFSSHSGISGLRRVAESTPGHAKIVIVHSGEEGGEEFKRFCEEIGREAYFPENGEEIVIEA